MTDDCDIDGDYRRTIEKLKQERAKVREELAESNRLNKEFAEWLLKMFTALSIDKTMSAGVRKAAQELLALTK